MFPITVVDSFFEVPNDIRELALRQSFSRFNNCGWPGLRSPMLLDIDQQLFNDVMIKVLSVFFKIPEDCVSVNFEAFFQYTTENFEEGWCHVDTDIDLAGVIYLTPNAPEDAGTSIYTTSSADIDYTVCKNKSLFYDGKIADTDQYRLIRDTFNSHFTKTVDIKNIYNRLAMYPGDNFHKENKFFGNTFDTARLTLVFFIKIRAENCLTPVQRIQQINR